MSAILLSSAAFFGYELTTHIIRNKIDFIYRCSIGVALGIAIQSLNFFVTTLFYPLNRLHGMTIAILYTIIALILHYFNTKFIPSLKFKATLIETVVLVVCSLVVGLYSKHVTLYKGHLAIGPTFADLPFHLNIIRSFSTGINYNRTSLFNVMSSFQANLTLAYPMFHNLYIAAMMNTDDSEIAFNLQVTAFLMAFISVVLIHGLSYEFSKDHTVATISVVLWMNLGGFGYWLIFTNGFRFNTSINYMNNLDGVFAYTLQPLLQILIPQRSALFSFPLVLGILICFVKMTKEKSVDIRYLILAGLCTCILPQLQIHSFVAIAQYSIMICIIGLFTTKNLKFWPYFWKWSLYGFISCSIGIPLTYPYWGRAQTGFSFLALMPLWSNGVYGKMIFPLIQIWWKGYGPFAYIMILFGWVTANKNHMIHWGASMFVWFTTTYIRYQPWEGDNLKLFAAVWIPIAVPYVVQFYMYVYRKAKDHKIIQYIVIFLIVQQMLATLVSLPHDFMRPLQVFFPRDQLMGEWIQENVPVEAVILSYNSRFNPATSIAGRQLFSGFIYWVAQHGVVGPNTKLIQNELLADKCNWKRWKDENIEYVLQKKRNAPTFSHEEQPFLFPLSTSEQECWEKVFESDWYCMYKLTAEPPQEMPKMKKNTTKTNKMKKHKHKNKMH